MFDAHLELKDKKIIMVNVGPTKGEEFTLLVFDDKSSKWIGLGRICVRSDRI